MISRTTFCLWGALLCCSTQVALAQEPEEPSTKVYRVADLIMPAPNYAFRGVFLPGTGNNPYGPGEASRRGGFGGMGGGMGGIGGGGGVGGGGMGGGGGFFSVPEDGSTQSENSSTDPAGSASASTVNMPGAAAYLAQTASAGQAGQQAGAHGVGGAGAMGMAMGGIGGVSSEPGGSLRFTLADLISAIQTTVEPGSWQDNGGQYSIFPLGSMLLINQTAEVHEKISELLDTLRSQGAALRSVTVEAHWLLVTNDDLLEIVPEGEGRIGASIDEASLQKLVDKQKAFRAEVTCFDGQTVHVMSGNLKSMVMSMIPVVGQLESLEEEQLAANRPSYNGQILPAIGGRTTARIEPVQQITPQRSVGYQPVVTTVNMGSLLQVTPILSDDSIVLDLQSIVVGGAVGEKPLEFQGLASLDRINVTAQQLMTTLRAPIGQPVLAGGMTMQPGAEGAAHQLYLVVEASLGPKAGVKAAK